MKLSSLPEKPRRKNEKDKKDFDNANLCQIREMNLRKMETRTVELTVLPDKAANRNESRSFPTEHISNRVRDHDQLKRNS